MWPAQVIVKASPSILGVWCIYCIKYLIDAIPIYSILPYIF